MNSVCRLTILTIDHIIILLCDDTEAKNQVGITLNLTKTKVMRKHTVHLESEVI